MRSGVSRKNLEMRHRVAMRTLGRDTAHRRALLRNQVTSLIEHERIETTVAKAKELRRVADRMVKYAKQNSINGRRQVFAFVQTRPAAFKMIEEIAPRMALRNGGYTRVLRTRNRRGDCAPMAVVEFSDTKNSILSPIELQMKEARKTKHRRQAASPPSLANALVP